MSHVDDGTIHAWLDGALLPGDPERLALEAHLEVCDECRARVDAERGIRDRATDVLRTVAPDAVRVEPFEEMIAARRAARAAAEAAAPPMGPPVPGQVDATTPITRAPRRRRYVPLAWAASLLMAVTAGWFARAYLPVTPASQDAAMESDLAVPEQEQPMASRVAEDQGLPAPPTAQAPTAGAVVAEGTAGDAGARRDAAAPGRSALAERQELARTEAENRAATGGLRSAEETRNLADAMTLGEARAQEAEAPPPTLQAMLIPDTSPLNEMNDAVLESYRSATWETVTEEQATARLGRVAARIEGLPLDSLQSSPNGAGWLVRVVQRTGAGEPVEILQWQEAIALDELVVTGVAGAAEQKTVARLADADSVARKAITADSALRQRAERQAGVAAAAPPPPQPAAEPLADNRVALRLKSIGFQVLVRANVSADSLASLAQRIR